MSDGLRSKNLKTLAKFDYAQESLIARQTIF